MSKLSRFRTSSALLTFVTAILILPAQRLPAQATGAGVALVAPKVVDDLIEKAGNEGNYLVFQAASQLRMLIESARLSANDVVDNTVRSANSAQQHVFENINRSVSLLGDALDRGTSNSQSIVDEVQQITSHVVPWGNDPIVTRAYPLVVAPRTSDSNIFIEFVGTRFSASDPTLTIDGKAIERISLKDGSATFSIPSGVLTWDENRLTTARGRLTLRYKKCSYLVFCHKASAEFDHALLLLPKQLAQIRVETTVLRPTRIYEEKTFERLHGLSTGDLTREHCEKETQAPHEPGYFIDTDSLAPTDYEENCPYPPNHRFGRALRESLCHGDKMTVPAVRGQAHRNWEFTEKYPTGYVVNLCAQSQMRSAFEKRNGDIHVHLSWKEYRKETLRSAGAVSDYSLKWNESYAPQSFPLDTESVLITATFFDGTKLKFDGNSSPKYLDVSWNAGTKQLILTSKKPTDIKGIN